MMYLDTSIKYADEFFSFDIRWNLFLRFSNDKSLSLRAHLYANVDKTDAHSGSISN